METGYQAYMKKRYRRLAPVYDGIGWIISSIREKVVDLAGPGMGSRVLDVATGTGAQAFAFAGTGCDVTGIDLSDDMIGVARKKNRRHAVRFMVADAADMPFEENEFDISVVSMALHEMSTPVREKTVLEMIRVTKPGGMLIAVDYGLSRDNPARRFLDPFFRLFESKHYEEFARFDLASLFEKFGVEIVEEKPVLFRTAKMVKGLNRKSRVASGRRVCLSAAGSNPEPRRRSNAKESP